MEIGRGDNGWCGVGSSVAIINVIILAAKVMAPEKEPFDGEVQHEGALSEERTPAEGVSGAGRGQTFVTVIEGKQIKLLPPIEPFALRGSRHLHSLRPKTRPRTLADLGAGALLTIDGGGVIVKSWDTSSLCLARAVRQ